MINAVDLVKTNHYQTEIDAAVKNLGAERGDLQSLLMSIVDKVSLQQIPGLLKQSYGRLARLRHVLAELSNLISDQDKLIDLGYQIESTLQPDDSFSFESALQGLDESLAIYIADKNLGAHVAMIYEMQALIHDATLNYNEAAKCYAAAATTSELPVEQQWFYEKQRALAFVDCGRELGDKSALEQAVSLLENTVMALAPQKQRRDDWATSQQAFGIALGILGQRQGGTRNLENAIAAFEAALSIRNPKDNPQTFSESQNSLGNALGALGHRLGDEEMLKNSVQAFELALEQQTKVAGLPERTTTQNNLAAVLQSQGQRNSDTKMLKRSVDLYKEILKVWTKECGPQIWATTMNNLGTALRLLGEHRKGPKTLQQSVAAYNSALSVQTREHFPQEWAMTQNNLGAALQKFAERVGNPEVFEQAIAAYENTLKEWTEQKAPMAWGMTLANLAVARRGFANLTADIKPAEKAVAELELVSDFFRNASHAQYSELCIDQLAQARKLVDELHLKGGKYADLVNH